MLLRFSSTTGRLEQTVAMPRLFRPVLAADDDGVYLIAAGTATAGPGPDGLEWIPLQGSPGKIARIDPATNRLVDTVHVNGFTFVSGRPSAASGPGTSRARRSIGSRRKRGSGPM